MFLPFAPLSHLHAARDREQLFDELADLGRPASQPREGTARIADNVFVAVGLERRGSAERTKSVDRERNARLLRHFPRSSRQRLANVATQGNDTTLQAFSQRIHQRVERRLIRRRQEVLRRRCRRLHMGGLADAAPRERKFDETGGPQTL
jgi:hypothetical protein